MEIEHMKDFERILFEEHNFDPNGLSQTMHQYDGNRCNRYQAILANAIEHQRNPNLRNSSESICLAINQNFNEPPLPDEEVKRLVRLITNPFAKTEIAKSLEIDLNQGILEYKESSPPHPFLFAKDVIPMGTLSVIGGLGGSGKSMAMVEMIVAAAIEAQYAKRSSTNKTCTLYLAFEDSQAELNARFSALMAKHSQAERDLIQKNVKAISLIGQSFQLVTMNGRNATPTGLSKILINKILELKALTNLEESMLVIDHARLVASIDWNDAAQVTVLTQELHKIAHEAKAAVVLIAHSPKNTGAKDHESSQADIAGSTALVDNARYVALVRGMNPSEAKNLGVTADARNNYIKLECVKSNYSKAGLIGWFIKTNCPNHHVATHTFVEPTKSIAPKEGDNASESRIIKYIRENPDLTLTDLRKRSGKNGVLGMSDLKVRDVVNSLLEKGLLIHIPASSNYSKKTTPNFKGVLGVSSHV